MPPGYNGPTSALQSEVAPPVPAQSDILDVTQLGPLSERQGAMPTSNAPLTMTPPGGPEELDAMSQFFGQGNRTYRPFQDQDMSGPIPFNDFLTDRGSGLGLSPDDHYNFEYARKRYRMYLDHFDRTLRTKLAYSPTGIRQNRTFMMQMFRLRQQMEKNTRDVNQGIADRELRDKRWEAGQTRMDRSERTVESRYQDTLARRKMQDAREATRETDTKKYRARASLRRRYEKTIDRLMRFQSDVAETDMQGSTFSDDPGSYAKKWTPELAAQLKNARDRLSELDREDSSIAGVGGGAASATPDPASEPSGGQKIQAYVQIKDENGALGWYLVEGAEDELNKEYGEGGWSRMDANQDPQAIGN